MEASRVTFYCDAEHQQADWVGIHERICQMLGTIRSPTVLSLQHAGCIQSQLVKAELIEMCRLGAQSKLSERKHQEALPAAQFCLRCSKMFTAPDLSKWSQPTCCWLRLTWVWITRSTNVLHRCLGRLHTVTGNLEAALFNFANDIYFASEEYGLDSTVTRGGYFLMANVYAKLGGLPIVRSLYSEVAQTWHCHLTKLLDTHVQNVQSPYTEMEPYDKAQRVEVDEMLRTMLEFEQNDSRIDSAQIALVAHCLAMLWFLAGDSLKALGFGNTALQASQLIPNHDLTEPIQGLLQLLHTAR
ncbi:hypothetical protein KUCAC02_012569 [Chaenocephalus aceratus]|uniref:Uncharacterized protein n=1 Tax=Chaenocephalus aceratus TaxID=36190 RepID=A0ACB9XC73_CHAAC|nr:hypothetical protein KUCAC02_012569 [Chaenocephalus aceratus]